MCYINLCISLWHSHYTQNGLIVVTVFTNAVLPLTLVFMYMERCFLDIYVLVLPHLTRVIQRRLVFVLCGRH